MATITNNTEHDFDLRAGDLHINVPAGKKGDQEFEPSSIECSDADLDKLMDHPVISHWFESGELTRSASKAAKKAEAPKETK